MITISVKWIWMRDEMGRFKQYHVSPVPITSLTTSTGIVQETDIGCFERGGNDME